MLCCKKSILAVLFCGLIFLSVSAEVGKSEEMVLNPNLSSVKQGDMPDNWTVWNPVFKKSACVIRPTSNGLMFEAPGRPHAVGGVFQHIKNIKGGQPYLIKAICQLQNIPDPYRSVYVRMNWTKAGKLGLDIVCLCEAITSVGTKTTGIGCAESIPGPTSKKLGDAARKNRIWVVAGIYERDGDHIYNTAILLDRSGKVAGKYRKIHLPREEWKDGITPGDSYPVFQTDFGTIAIQICYDWFFPEPTAIFALQGAEIVFAPT